MPAADTGRSLVQQRPAPFAHLAGANLAAQAAEQVSLAAVPMVAVLMLGAGARETGLLAAAQSLPFLLLALPFGLLADRTSRRGLMLAAEAMRVLAMMALAALVVTASGAALSLPALALFGFILFSSVSPSARGLVALPVGAGKPAFAPRCIAAWSAIAGFVPTAARLSECDSGRRGHWQ